MAYKDDSKFSVEDFANTKSIDDLLNHINDYNVNDANGYTPLCFMAMNSCRPDLIVYIASIRHNEGDYGVAESKVADVNKQCDKGMLTPLQCACISGNTSAIDALLGTLIDKRDSGGNLVLKLNADGNPIPKKDDDGNLIVKKDAAGNPIPKRDENDDIIYIKDKYGTPLPLYVEDGEENYTVQYRAYSTYKDESTGKIIVKSVCKVPQMTPEHPHIKLKYKKDAAGNHQPMRDEDGNPYKQYDKDTLQPINKIDSNTLKPIRNKFEYVWDYEYLPEYELEYEIEQVNITNTATVCPADIFQAASNKDSSILIALSGKNSSGAPLYVGKWDTSYATDTTFSDNYESPLIAACRMQAMDSVNLILDKISTDQTLNNKVINAVLHSTKKLMDISENVYSIAAGFKDETIFKSIDSHIEKPDDGNTFSDVIINKMIAGTEENPAPYYKLLNLFKGVGKDTGKFTEDNLSTVYDSIDDDTLIIGTDEYTSLLESKWPYPRPDQWAPEQDVD